MPSTVHWLITMIFYHSDEIVSSRLSIYFEWLSRARPVSRFVGDLLRRDILCIVYKYSFAPKRILCHDFKATDPEGGFQ